MEETNTSNVLEWRASNFIRTRTLDEIAKRNKNKDYHSEKLLSGDPEKGDYNIAISGKKGIERYSKSLIKKGNQLQSTRTRTLKAKDGEQITTNKIKQTKLGENEYHIESEMTLNRNRELRINKKL